MGLFSSGEMHATASEGDGSSGGGGSSIFGNIGRFVADAVNQAESQKGTSEESPGNAKNMKKGGKVKGWGKARGARAAKYY